MTAQRIPYRAWFGLLLMAVIAVAFRMNAGLYSDLWEDEIIATTHAMQPLWEIPIEVTRHDVHPLLYFLQLHLWSLLGTTDVWFKLNSVVWNVAAICSIGIVGRRLYGAFVGLAAAALFAVYPPTVWMAQEIRPYDWLYVLIIWNFYAAEVACGTGFARRLATLPLLLLSVAIIYSHAIGFFIVFLFGVYALGRLWSSAAGYRLYVGWLAVFGLAAVLAIPPLIVALMRNANLGAGDTPAEVAAWIPRLVLPRGEDPAVIWLAACVYLAVVIFGLLTRPARLITATFLVLPIALAAALDAYGMVLFKPNVFSTMVAPFVVLVVALSSQRLRPILREVAICLFACLFILGSIEYLDNRVPTTGFLAASQLIRSKGQAGDVVYVPQQSMFWGMAWYLVGPKWGSALAISGVPDRAWRAMYNRLGSRLVSFLHLEPTTQSLTTSDGLTLLAGPESAPQAVTARRVWLVTYQRADLPDGYPPATLGKLTAHLTVPVQFLVVTLYE